MRVMPVAGQFTWTEKSDHLVVKVPLKGVSPKNVDIFCTENILKVNYAPFLIDILLYAPIDPNQHRAKVKDGVLEIKLFKQTRGTWGQIDSELVDKDKEAASIARSASLRKQEELEISLKEKRKVSAVENDRFATRAQMALDEAERTRIEDLQAEEKRIAEEEMFDTFAKMKEAEVAEKKSKRISMQKKDSIAASGGERGPASLMTGNGVSVNVQPSVFEVDRNKTIDRTEFSKHNVDNIDEDEDYVFIEENDVALAKGDVNSMLGADEDFDEDEDEEIKYTPPPRQGMMCSPIHRSYPSN